MESAAAPPVLRARSSQDDYSCPVCMDLLVSPMTLACGHTVCMPCLASWLAMRHELLVTCPCGCGAQLSRTLPGVNIVLRDRILKGFAREYEERQRETAAISGDLRPGMTVPHVPNYAPGQRVDGMNEVAGARGGGGGGGAGRGEDPRSVAAGMVLISLSYLFVAFVIFPQQDLVPSLTLSGELVEGLADASGKDSKAEACAVHWRLLRDEDTQDTDSVLRWLGELPGGRVDFAQYAQFWESLGVTRSVLLLADLRTSPDTGEFEDDMARQLLTLPPSLRDGSDKLHGKQQRLLLQIHLLRKCDGAHRMPTPPASDLKQPKVQGDFWDYWNAHPVTTMFLVASAVYSPYICLWSMYFRYYEAFLLLIGNSGWIKFFLSMSCGPFTLLGAAGYFVQTHPIIASGIACASTSYVFSEVSSGLRYGLLLLCVAGAALVSPSWSYWLLLLPLSEPYRAAGRECAWLSFFVAIYLALLWLFGARFF